MQPNTLPERRWPLMTWFLVVANVAIFGLEVFGGGSTNTPTLLRLGAAELWMFHGGQWWRVVTANFLHYGAAHLVINMLSLLVIGPFVEQTLGRVGCVLIYMLSGCGAMWSVMFIAWHWHWREPSTPVVGASGAIMGLVGATLAILLTRWLRQRAPIAGARLGWMLLIVVLQIVVDRFSKQVNGTAHVAGLIVGFATTLPVLLLFRRRLLPQVARV